MDVNEYNDVVMSGEELEGSVHTNLSDQDVSEYEISGKLALGWQEDSCDLKKEDNAASVNKLFVQSSRAIIELKDLELQRMDSDLSLEKREQAGRKYDEKYENVVTKCVSAFNAVKSAGKLRHLENEARTQRDLWLDVLTRVRARSEKELTMKEVYSKEHMNIEECISGGRRKLGALCHRCVEAYLRDDTRDIQSLGEIKDYNIELYKTVLTYLQTNPRFNDTRPIASNGTSFLYHVERTATCADQRRHRADCTMYDRDSQTLHVIEWKFWGRGSLGLSLVETGDQNPFKLALKQVEQYVNILKDDVADGPVSAVFGYLVIFQIDNPHRPALELQLVPGEPDLEKEMKQILAKQLVK